VQLDDRADEIFMVFRTRVFFTELLHLANNHRILIQNSRLRAMTVQNLSRFASARGLREKLVIKVGYEVTGQQVEKLFEQVMAEALADPDIPVEEKYAAEVRPLDAGDYAVEWACFYYTKEARALLKTRQSMLALVLRIAHEQELSLASPMLVQTGQIA
jgi:small-conductance mechanosensitive channel